jgi:molybdopterin molybdotransferase
MEPDGLDIAWTAFRDAATAACPGFPGMLAGPASPEALAMAEARLGRPLPVDLRDLLARHDGSSGARILPEEWALLPAAEVAEEHAAWAALRLAEFLPEGLGCDPVGAIRADEWVRPGWIPFAANGMGDFLCLDMDPAPGGTEGQVITLWHDDARREVLAPSLPAWLSDRATDLRAGRLVWDAAAGLFVTPGSD